MGGGRMRRREDGRLREGGSGCTVQVCYILHFLPFSSPSPRPF